MTRGGGGGSPFFSHFKSRKGGKRQEREERRGEEKGEGAVSGQIMTDRLEAKKEEFKFTAVSGVDLGVNQVW